jgi:hypothetical protein
MSPIQLALVMSTAWHGRAMDDVSGHRFVLHGFVWPADPILIGAKIPINRR